MLSSGNREGPQPLNGRAGPVRREAEVLLLLPRPALTSELRDRRSTDPPWGCSPRGGSRRTLAKSAKNAKCVRVWRDQTQNTSLRTVRTLREAPWIGMSMEVHETRVHEIRGRRACSDQPSPFMGNKGERLRSNGVKCWRSSRIKIQDQGKQQEPRNNEETRSRSKPSHAECVSASIRGRSHRSRNEFGMTGRTVYGIHSMKDMVHLS